MIRRRSPRLLLLGCTLAWSAGCGDDPVRPLGATTPSRPSVTGVLVVDMRGKAHTRIDPTSAGAVAVTLDLEEVDALGLFDGAQTRFTADGRVEAIPESGGELYSATFSLPSGAGTRCGSEPVSLALSLYRAAPNMRFAGALTGYCGERFHGVPSAILRLSGVLEELP